ncbi:Transcription factor [Akanthomyces lecanii RCEF 1005]|uniref:Transcription factor n=1 Tax=Akanthomyces lecanii RCEF 1005 TaxID=1081108 RepID=A0A168D0C3_CORDF|nr:Transcription factor [Akanthomyces lecanii RCEF 1005]
MADSAPPTTGSKRRRIALACTSCRTRKSRCDGRRPTCSTCQQLGFECQYDAPDSTTNIIVQKDYVSGLEQRLKKVEHVLQRHDDLLTGHLSACAPGRERYEELPGGPLPLRGANFNDGIEIDASVIESGDSESEAEARTDGLAITFVDERAAAYFGESSNIGFVRYLLASVSSIWGAKQPEGPQLNKGDNADVKRKTILSSEHSPLGALPTTPQSLATSSRLPAVEDMEIMMNRYFNTMGLLFPFLHESTFRQTFNAFKASGFNKVRQTWLGELNLIFAIASNINRGKTSKQCFEESLVYYRRAMSLCGASSLRTVSLDIVQFLLLQALYLQGTPQAGEAWSVHGLLVRSAVALGLHSDKVGRQLDEIVQEMRNRTWHTIYCLDTVLSATFGRPCAIIPAHMTVRLPQAWPVLANAQLGNSPETAQVATDFLSISVQLYQIMGLSIEAQYNGNIGTEQNEDEVSMLQTASTLRQKLRRWAETLPSDFALLPSSSPDLKHSSRMNKLRAITTVRYHSISILIHRPLLCVTLKHLSKINGRHDVELPYTTQLAMAEAFECISSAEETIGMAASVFGGGPVEDSNLGVWFFTLYYVFTAALMVCGGMLCARHSHRVNAETVVAEGRLNLVKAADALENLDNSNPLVKRCVKYIRYLSELQDYRSDSDIYDVPSEEVGVFGQMEGVDFMGMVDLLDDHSGLGPYLAAELFDTAMFDSLTMP